MKKNVIITGAGGNLGQAVVRNILSQGCRVIAFVSPGKRLSNQSGEDIVQVEVDLTKEAEVQKAIEALVIDQKSIDAALLLAGGYASGGIDETDGSQLRKMFSLNFETAYNVARPVFAQMLKQSSGGRIVFVGARTALIAKDGKGSLAYGLSKSLIFKLSEYLNAEGSTKNVMSTVVVPSTIDTPQNRQAMPTANFSNWVSPEAIAEVMSFAISEKASPLRDTVLKVYGMA